MITADQLGVRLGSLERVGRDHRGTTRLAWTSDDVEAGMWFEAQAAGLGLRTERDPAGNRWALPDAPGPWWAVGSHLDSVREGGRFDGALGVVAGFAIAAAATRPIAVLALADEEGARFNTPTFGSRALTGVLDVESSLSRVDDAGTTLADAMRMTGLAPERLSEAAAWLPKLRGFLELHIDQTKDVAEAGAPFGIVSGLASRMRLAVELRGSADHAGTTPMATRRDALASAARLIVFALDTAGGERRVTATRLIAEPNALTTIASRVRLWLDVRGPAPELLDQWEAALRERGRALAATAGVELELHVESRSSGVEFDRELRAQLRSGGAPEVLCYAGHDAGLIAPRRPAAMVLVRNPSGVSHSAAEDVSLEDAAAGANAMLRLLEEVGA